jgi:sec-independent protein translocase protein TatC
MEMTIKRKKRPTPNKASSTADPLLWPFAEHLRELRRRFFSVAAVILAGSVLAYVIQDRLIAALLWPANNQNFIYTSPAGGFNFVLRLCLYVGLVISIPFIIYHILRFIEPLLSIKSRAFITRFSVLAGVLALLGIAFGYFVGLPVALDFLQRQFISSQVTALFTLQEYTSFVSFYLLAASSLFLVPLLMWFINHFKRLKPKTFLRYEKHVILAIVVFAAIITPTVDAFNLTLIAVPLILTYQVGIFIIWRVNRNKTHRYSNKIMSLLEQDKKMQEQRSLIAANSRPIFCHPGPMLNRSSPPVIVDVVKRSIY